MNKKAEKLYSRDIELKCPDNLIGEGVPVTTDTDTDRLIKEIVEKSSQTAVNKIDEVTVMQCMLNDKKFRIAEINRKTGEYTGSHSPRETALGLSSDMLMGLTGVSKKEAYHLVEDYEFTKKDAQNFVDISKDFTGTYLQTGRKITMVTEPRGEATVHLKYIDGHVKSVPDKDNGGSKTVQVDEKVKLVASNKR